MDKKDKVMNKENKIEFQAVSYNDIKNGIEFKNDKYGLAAYLTKTRIKTFFANPNLQNFDECLMSLERVDGIIAGRSMLFATKIKINEEIYPCQSGSTLDVPEEYQGTTRHERSRL